MRIPVSLYFSNLSKNYGHPILHPAEGIDKLRTNSKKTIDLDDIIATKTLWMFRKTYFSNFFRRKGHYPGHVIIGKLHPTLLECFRDDRVLTANEAKSVPLVAWSNVKLIKNHDMTLEIDEKELLKDTACSSTQEKSGFGLTTNVHSFICITKENRDVAPTSNQGFLLGISREMKVNLLRRSLTKSKCITITPEMT